MAYASLLSLTQTLEQILGSRHKEKQIKSLHEKLSFLLSFLEDSSHKNTESITCLEARIRDATYEAEDIIELHMSKPILSDSACQGVINREIISALQIMIPVFHNSERCVELERHSFKEKYEDLQKVIKEIDSILEEVEKMKAMKDIEGSSADGLMQIKDPLSAIEGIEEVVKTKDVGDILDLQPRKSLRATSSKSSSVNKDAMVGFEDDLLQIKERLVGQSSMLKFISIVGMGGIGKTTLAKNIYNDSYIEHHFDIRAWITLSQDYLVQERLEHLLKSMGGLTNEMNQKETDELKTLVYKRLKGNRYLIVMDDVWDDKVLDEFRRIFPDDNNGSRIILTTRLSSVAAVYADSSSPIHHLSFLSPKQSWNLLCQKALGKECCPPELEEIGKRIAEKCRGLPLALVVIGGVLYKAEKTRANWKYIAENVKSAVTGNDDDFMEILSWSYNRLPHRLRACFLYMGGFPEDSAIHVSLLIRLWVAEGFIKPIAHNSLEEVAKRYLEELIDRNLIMVRRRVYGGEIKTCSMHDIMRELCVKKAEKEKFLYIANQEVEIPLEVMKNHRHLSIMKNHHRLSIHRPTFRSLLYFTGELLPNPRCFQLLRVLEASKIYFYEFPIEIVKLVNLRYIALFGRGEFMIPIEISELCNLQTLIVLRSPHPKRLFLPPELLKMPQLRHLLFDGGVLLCSHGPQNENLQTLSGVRDFRFTQEALQIIPNLKTLGISYCCNTQTELSFYCLENLVHLHQLESFKCIVLSYDGVPLPENLAFPPNLKKLTLSGCGISSNNMLVVGSLPNLEVLKLKEVAFESNAWKTKEGEFSRLKLLLVEALCFEFWEAEAAHFPILQCVCLSRCMKLECIPSGIGEIPTLQQIILYGCSPSVEISANSILQEQQDLGNDDFVVHVSPTAKVSIGHKILQVVLKLEYVDEKMKVKAMKTVTTLSGVESIAVNPKDKKMTVIGDMDPVKMVRKLRKLCHTELMTVVPAKVKHHITYIPT